MCITLMQGCETEIYCWVTPSCCLLQWVFPCTEMNKRFTLTIRPNECQFLFLFPSSSGLLVKTYLSSIKLIFWNNAWHWGICLPSRKCEFENRGWFPIEYFFSKNCNGVRNNNYCWVPVKSLPFSIFDQFSAKYNPVNCCWPSPAQSFMVSSSVGTHWSIFVLSRVLCGGVWLLLVTLLPHYRGVIPLDLSQSTNSQLTQICNSSSQVNFSWPSSAQLFFVPNPKGLTSIFYYLTTLVTFYIKRMHCLSRCASLY
jgi:hypothetical protein